jgi:uncharacterized protein (DUF433 family)
MSTTRNKSKLVRETVKGEVYEYYPLGKYIVSAPGICGGRPTFKYTRLEVSTILARLAAGDTVAEVVRAYASSKLAPQAVTEAIRLADRALLQSTQLLQTPA